MKDATQRLMPVSNRALPRKYLAASGLAFLMLALLMPRSGFAGDIACWTSWTKAILLNGVGRAYDLPDINYNPLFLYILALFGRLQGSATNIEANINYLKLITLLFDFGAVYLAMRLLLTLDLDAFPTFFILFNIAYLYDTLIWGQVDSIHTFLILASVMAALKEKTVLSALLLLLALNQKTQAMVFVPQIAILLIPQFIANKRRISYAVASLLAVQAVILLPFVLSGTLWPVIRTIAGTLAHYNAVSFNAFNMWHLLLTGDLGKLPDSGTYLQVSYKTWGLLLFVLSIALILLPTYAILIDRLKQKRAFSMRDYRVLFLSLALSAVAFFFFNTQMHERYVHPAILFAAIYAILSRDYLFYALLSLAYFLNLEKALEFFRWDHSIWIFDARFVASIFLACFLLGLWRLYQAAAPDLSAALLKRWRRAGVRLKHARA